MNILSILGPVASLLGYSDAMALLNDIIALSKSVTEGGLDQAISDTGTLVGNRIKTLKQEQIQAAETILIAVVAAYENKFVTGSVEAVFAAIVHELPVLIPNLTITQEHGDAFVRAGVNLLSDLGVK
ncbi:MAG: hypothetical protein KGJ13_05750 [Patescibacteria group bacterium]|nr:hypothetical protein [Patescibacteria group bacterium]